MRFGVPASGLQLARAERRGVRRLWCRLILLAVLQSCSRGSSRSLATLQLTLGVVERDFARQPKVWQSAEVGARFGLGDGIQTRTDFAAAGCSFIRRTRVVCCDLRGDCRDVSTFDFLGFTFGPRLARAKSGQLFLTYGPAISRRAAKGLRETVRRQSPLQRCCRRARGVVASAWAHCANMYGIVQ
jgi:hypothetical protein